MGGSLGAHPAMVGSPLGSLRFTRIMSKDPILRIPSHAS